MPDYKKMYFQLAAKIGDVIEVLVEAKRQGEWEHVDGETPVIALADIELKAKSDDNR